MNHKTKKEDIYNFYENIKINGVQLYQGAIDVLNNLNKLNKRFVLISNAPRPASSVKKYLLKLKMNQTFLKNIFTSG